LALSFDFQAKLLLLTGGHGGQPLQLRPNHLLFVS
jgi:predicted metal-dependent peptidase